MSQSLELRLEFFYQQALIIWEKFCLIHRELFDITSQEYLILLEGNIESLETLIQNKNILIQEVGKLETLRSELITDINSYLKQDEKIHKVYELINFFSLHQKTDSFNSLQKLNNLLIDIIEKLQDQNKKNQQYLNKAMISVKELQDSFKGKKNYQTYGSDGLTRSMGK